jgi:capsular exopolysaccharide synthesis family protein
MMKAFPNPEHSGFGPRKESYIELVSRTGSYLPPAQFTGTSEEPRFNAGIDVVDLIKRYWLLFLGLMLLGLAGGVASVVLDSPVYGARVILEVMGINEALLRNSLEGAGHSSEDTNIQTQIQLMRGGPFLRRVFERLQSETVPLAPVGTDFFSRLRQRVRPGTNEPLQAAKDGLTVALSTFDARPINRTRLIELTCDSTNPDVASQFLNTMASEVIEEALRSRIQSSQKTSEWLAAQIEETKTKLHETEERLSDFIRSSGNLFVSPDATLDDAKLIQLRGELSRIQAERIAKQTRYELTTKNPPERLPQVLDDGGLRSYQQKINDLNREKAALETTFTSQHPKVKVLDAQITTLQSNLRNELAGVVSRIRSDYETAIRQEKSLAAEYAAQSQRVSASAGQASQYNALKREVETIRQMYQSLLMQANQVGMSNSIPVAPMRLVEPSSPARLPYKPRPVLNLSFGAVVGFAFTVGIVFLREKLDRRVKSPGLSEAFMNAQELGVIPSFQIEQSSKGLLSRFQTKEEENRLVPAAKLGDGVSFWQNGSSVLAESFRATLASVLRDDWEAGVRVIMITSADPGEGKTMIAANLGIALAETGKRVLLVDGDFRRPRLHHVFQVNNERGLINLMTEETPVGEYTADSLGYETAIPHLTLLPNRPVRHYSLSKVLHSRRLAELVETMQSQYDTVIVDAPPILNVADARIIGRLADGVILVVRAQVTDKRRAMAAYQRISSDGLKLIGTVLNDWNPSKSHLKNYYYYSCADTDGRS